MGGFEKHVAKVYAIIQTYCQNGSLDFPVQCQTLMVYL